jgi:hypothetical protein
LRNWSMTPRSARVGRLRRRPLSRRLLVQPRQKPNDCYPKYCPCCDCEGDKGEREQKHFCARTPISLFDRIGSQIPSGVKWPAEQSLFRTHNESLHEMQPFKSGGYSPKNCRMAIAHAVNGWRGNLSSRRQRAGERSSPVTMIESTEDRSNSLTRTISETQSRNILNPETKPLSGEITDRLRKQPTNPSDERKEARERYDCLIAYEPLFN